MLQHLRIEDLALVDELTCEFGPGLNVLTGETGAGKSVVLGALSLLLGQRADRSAIRSGADRCVVEAVLRLPANLPIAGILSDAGADGGEELILRRIIAGSGSNRQFANGAAVPLGVLAEIGDWMVDMHGPHDHQSLLRRQAQLDLLDAYGKADEPRADCESTWRAMRDIRQRIESLSGDDHDVARAIEMLTFQVKEIDDADLRPGEDEDVREQYRRADRAGRMLELASQAAGALGESEANIADGIARVVRVLEELASIDEPAADLADQARGLAIDAQELGNALARYAESLDCDPESLRRLEERLNLIESLRRKYGATVEEIRAFADDARTRLDELQGRDEQIRGLQEDQAGLQTRFEKRASELSSTRRKTAATVARKVTRDLEHLGFSGARLQVDLEPAEPGPSGRDLVEFLFTPNAGEEPRPLRMIASSGEVSRVMLALKAAFAEQDKVPVLLFDEIDVNVGGEVAHAVGETMQKIARRRQVLCITHLAQVACRADHHFRVDKRADEGRARTSITKVEGDDRIDEIARMLGGSRRASRAADHARQLLEAGRGDAGW